MSLAFLDTFFVLALVNSEDEYHRVAVETRKDHRHGSVTTEYVLLEVLDALTSGAARELGLQIVDAIRNDKSITAPQIVTPRPSHRGEREWLTLIPTCPSPLP